MNYGESFEISDVEKTDFKDFKDYLKKLFFLQINRINMLSTKEDLIPFAISINILEANLSAYIDEIYKGSLEKKNKELNEELKRLEKKNYPTEREKFRMQMIDFLKAKNKLSELMKLIDRKFVDKDIEDVIDRYELDNGKNR